MTPASFRRIALLVATTALLPISSAWAQSAEAEALFRDGRKLIKQNQLMAGCDKLEASARLESSVGTLLNLGDCRERLGKRASAWAAFRKAEAVAKRDGKDDKRRQEAGKRAATLEPTLANLVIQVEQRVDNLVLRRNGEIVDAAIWNTAVPIDPGTYAVVAEAPGFKTWRGAVTIDQKTRRQVVLVPRLVARDPAPAAPPVATVPAASIVAPPAPVKYVAVQRSAGVWSTSRAISAGLAIASVGALGTGVYFGMRSADLEKQSNDRCPLQLCADPEGVRLNDAAQTAGTRANVLYVAGGIGVVTATILWLTGRPHDETIIVPMVGDGRFGVGLSGRL